jgi:hypothetical protein
MDQTDHWCLNEHNDVSNRVDPLVEAEFQGLAKTMV